MSPDKKICNCGHTKNHHLTRSTKDYDEWSEAYRKLVGSFWNKQVRYIQELQKFDKVHPRPSQIYERICLKCGGECEFKRNKFLEQVVKATSLGVKLARLEKKELKKKWKLNERPK